MFDLLLVFIGVLFIFWYIKSRGHPKNFPPGPRLPLPILGDSYKLGKNLNSGFQSLTKKYGNIVGLWMGSNRAVVISDFEVLQDILIKNETASRRNGPSGSKFTFNFKLYFEVKLIICTHL